MKLTNEQFCSDQTLAITVANCLLLSPVYALLELNTCVSINAVFSDTELARVILSLIASPIFLN